MSKSTPPNTTTKPKAGAKSAQSRARTKNTQGKTSASQADFKQERALTPKQAAFVREYLIDLNGTQAAIRAGYSERTANEQAARLLANVSVSKAVADAQAERADRLEITADRVLAELAKIGFADMRDVASWGETVVDEDGKPIHGVKLVSSDKLTDSAAAAISEIAETPAGLRIKLHDKRAALVDMGKHLGMFTEKIEHSGAIQVQSTVTFVMPKHSED
ncbi:putative terminase small subunit [Bacillus phage vB_BspP_Dartukuta]|nr:putative terminase small subunit [Bacillus phage vB_BspP_Dartukuta]